MNLKEYFSQNSGTAILATAGSEGKVDAAIYSKPHLIEENSIALLMSNHLSHVNLQQNPYACYLFKQEGPGWQGIRIYLKMIDEESNTDLARSLVRRRDVDVQKIDVCLVYFQVEQILPLAGN